MIREILWVHAGEGKSPLLTLKPVLFSLPIPPEKISSRGLKRRKEPRPHIHIVCRDETAHHRSQQTPNPEVRPGPMPIQEIRLAWIGFQPQSKKWPVASYLQCGQKDHPKGCEP